MKNKLLISFILFAILLSFFTCSFANSDNDIEFTSVWNKEYAFNLSDELLSLPYVIFTVRDLSEAFGYPCQQLVYYGCEYEPTYYYGDEDKNIPAGFYFYNPYVEDSNKVDYYYKSYAANSSSVLDQGVSLFNTAKLSNLSYYNGGAFNDSNCRPDYVFYSSFDIKDENGHVVFQKAPSQVTIPAIQQVEEIPQVMGQVMKILIPIGLIVFSIGLVIYLTRLVISRVQ